MNGRKIYKLSDIADVQTGPFGSQLHQRDYVDVGTPCIMPCNIGANLDVKTDNIAHLKDADILRLNKYCVKVGDIIYSRRGDIEKCAYINQLQEGWLCGTGCLRIRPNTAMCFPKYLAYLLSTKESKKWIVANAVGTTMLNLNSSILNTMPISLPPLAEQKRIADILSAIDDKIELNRRINANLEQQAQALYKSWFVDFEPFGGKMPEDWKEGRLEDIGEIVGGGTPSKSISDYYTSNGIAWITPKDLSLTHAKFTSKGEIDITELGYVHSSAKLMPRGSILFSSRAPIGYISIAKNDICTNQGFKSVIPYNGCTAYIYYYLLANTLNIEAQASGSTFKEASGTLMKSLDILIPDDITLAKFEHTMHPFLEQQELIEEQNYDLSNLRDTLLPRLMKGEY